MWSLRAAWLICGAGGTRRRPDKQPSPFSDTSPEMQGDAVIGFKVCMLFVMRASPPYESSRRPQPHAPCRRRHTALVPATKKIILELPLQLLEAALTRERKICRQHSSRMITGKYKLTVCGAWRSYTMSFGGAQDCPSRTEGALLLLLMETVPPIGGVLLRAAALFAWMVTLLMAAPAWTNTPDLAPSRGLGVMPLLSLRKQVPPDTAAFHSKATQRGVAAHSTQQVVGEAAGICSFAMSAPYREIPLPMKRHCAACRQAVT